VNDRRVNDSDINQTNRNHADSGKTLSTFHEVQPNTNAVQPNPTSRHMKKNSLDFKNDEINRSPVASPE
jgi:hypothetical protein